MLTKNNEIIHDMHTEDMTQVVNLDKIRFGIGTIREEHETFTDTKFGKPYHYIKSKGIYFPISKDSADAILDKITRLNEIKKDIEEMHICNLEEKKNHENISETMKSKKRDTVKNTEWIFYKIDAHLGAVISIPNDAICITHTNIGEFDRISWLEPYKR